MVRWGLPQWLSRKNLPSMQEPQKTQVQSLGQEDPLEKEMASHSSILAWNPMDKGSWWTVVHKVEKQTQLK